MKLQWALGCALCSGLTAYGQAISNSGFESGLTGWTATGSWSTPVQVVPWRPTETGNHVARILNANENRRLEQRGLTFQKGRLYELSFYIRRSSNFATLPAGQNRLGVDVNLFMPTGPAQSIYEIKFDPSFDEDRWTRVVQRFGVPQNGTLDLLLAFRNFTGEVFLDDFLIRDVTVNGQRTRVFPHPTFGPLTCNLVRSVARNNSFPWNYSDPEGGGVSTDIGFALYQRDSDYIGPRSAPRPSEVAPAGLATSRVPAVRGETSVATLGVFMPEGGVLEVTGSDFVCTDPPASFPFANHARIQIGLPTDKKVQEAGADLTFVERLELLSETNSVAVAPKSSTVVWVQAKPPANIPPGAYSAEISLSSGGHTSTWALTLDIAGFALSPADNIYWALDADTDRWDLVDPSLAESEIADFADHGINTLLVSTPAYQIGFNGTTGRVQSYQLPYWVHQFVPALNQLGMSNLILKFSGSAESTIYQSLYEAPPPSGLFLGPWPQEVITEYQALWGFVDQYFAASFGAASRWWHFGPDEPSVSADLLALADRQALYYPTGYDLFTTADVRGIDLQAPNLADRLTSRCYVGSVAMRRSEQAAQRSIDAAPGPISGPDGTEFWVYNGGSYAFAAGNMIRNRYYNGLLFWKLHELEQANPARRGAVGMMNHTYQRTFGNSIFDDFDSLYRDFALVYESPTQRNETPQWEGLRQGTLDFRYADTVRSRIRSFQSSASCLRENFADSRWVQFRALVDGLPYDMDTCFVHGGMDNPRLDAVRSQLHQLISEFDLFLADQLFADGFESGDLSAWPPAQGSAGQLTVSPASSACGAYSLQVSLAAGAQTAYLADSTLDREASVRIEFAFDRHSLALAAGASGNILALRDDHAGLAAVRLRVRNGSTPGGLQMRVEARDDTTAAVYSSSWATVAAVAGQAVAVQVEFVASGPQANDGRVQAWINGTSIGAVTGLDNDALAIDRAFLGAILGFVGTGGANSGGAFRLDDYRSSRINP